MTNSIEIMSVGYGYALHYYIREFYGNYGTTIRQILFIMIMKMNESKSNSIVVDKKFREELSKESGIISPGGIANLFTEMSENGILFREKRGVYKVANENWKLIPHYENMDIVITYRARNVVV